MNNTFHEDANKSPEPKFNPEQFFRINRKFSLQISAIKEMVSLVGIEFEFLAPAFSTGIIESGHGLEAFRDWLNG